MLHDTEPASPPDVLHHGSDAWMMWVTVSPFEVGSARVSPSECFNQARALWSTGGLDRLLVEYGDDAHWFWHRSGHRFEPPGASSGGIATGNSRPPATAAVIRRVRITVDLDPALLTLLDVTAEHLGKTRDEVVADGLRALFAALPRPNE